MYVCVYIFVCMYLYIYIYLNMRVLVKYLYVYVCENTCVYIYVYKRVHQWSRDWNSVPGQVIPKTQKMVHDAFLLKTQYYKIWIKGKWSNPGKETTSSSKPLCSSYWKGSLQVALDYNWLTYIYIYIYNKYILDIYI